MKKTLGKEFAFAIFLVALISAAVIIGIAFYVVNRGNEAYFQNYAASVTNGIARFTDRDLLVHCLESGEKDEYYDELQGKLQDVVEMTSADYIMIEAIDLADVDQRVFEEASDMTQDEIDAAFSLARESFFMDSQEDSGDKIGDADYLLETANKYDWSISSGSMVGNGTERDYWFVVYAHIPKRAVYETERMFVFLIALIGLLLSLLVAFLGARSIRKHMVLPILSISRRTADFVNRQEGRGTELTREEKAAEDLIEKRQDELGALNRSLKKMEEDTRRYVEDLRLAAEEKEKLASELDMAARIQLAVLPGVEAPFSDNPHFRLWASMKAAREVGGDFYDFFMTDETHAAFVMADVSGKGMPASLFMMASKSLIKTMARAESSPAKCLEKVNHMICENNPADMFVTVWLGILDLETGHMVYANAGHEYPALMRADGSFALMVEKHGFVVGGMDGIRYRDFDITLEKGDKLFLYTDGVPEATNASDELFGTDRMIESLNRAGKGSPEEIEAQIHKDIDAFVGEAPQFDDMTMLVLEMKT